MKGKVKVSLACTLLATALSTGVARAQQSFEHTVCRAGTASVLAKADKVIVFSLEQYGVVRSKVANDPLGGHSQKCICTVANIEGKSSGNGWCKEVGPTPDDWLLVAWVLSADKPGHGKFAFKYGAGKWKGITGGGTFEPDGNTVPIEPGTYQNCIRAKGTWRLPG